MTTSEVKELKKEVKKYIDRADERMVKVMYAILEADQQENWGDHISEGERDLCFPATGPIIRIHKRKIISKPVEP